MILSRNRNTDTLYASAAPPATGQKRPDEDPLTNRNVFAEKGPTLPPVIKDFPHLVNVLRAQLRLAQSKVTDVETPKSFRPGYSPIMSMYTPLTSRQGFNAIDLSTRRSTQEFSSQINPTIVPMGMGSTRTGGPRGGTITQLALSEINIFLQTYLQQIQQGNTNAFDLAVERSYDEIGKFVRSSAAISLNQQDCRKINNNMYSSQNPEINPRLGGQWGSGSQVSPQRYCDYASQVQRVYNYIIKPVFDYVNRIESTLANIKERTNLKESRTRYDVLKGNTEKLTLR